MTPTMVSGRIMADRLHWADRMLKTIRDLPLEDHEAFFADSRNIWTADACLRRALEALFDLGRHIVARGFGEAPSEYKEVAIALSKHNVLTAEEADLLQTLAGYRNRLVHFYHEVSAEELYDVCAHHLQDVDRMIAAYRRWAQDHPERIDNSL
ncbi:MAG: DUF86 domain-containing protein [Chloroflexota bacterium]|nr:MAG: DUF86 domain-containing protein [Chloroflexota bacterium]